MLDFLQQFADAKRIFQYDYIYIDAVFLIIWLIFLLKNKKHSAILFGAIIAPIIYSIDAIFWWNKQAGANFPPTTSIREYIIGGIQMPHPLGEFWWLKFGADFMMTISYSLFAFPWIFIMFESISKKKIHWKQIIKFSAVYFLFWILIPLLSGLLNIDNKLVEAVRHMDTQFITIIASVIIGYLLLLVVYRKEPIKVLKVFAVGVAGSLIMELPLFIFKIRPTNIEFIAFEALFLLNQGVPYLFLVWDKFLKKRITSNQT